MLRSIMVDLNHAGYLFFEDRKLGFLSESFKKTKNDEYRSNVQKSIDEFEFKVSSLKQRESELLLKIAEEKKRLAESEQIYGEVARQAEQNRQVILKDIETYTRRKDELLRQLRMTESEHASLGFFQSKRKKDRDSYEWKPEMIDIQFDELEYSNKTEHSNEFGHSDEAEHSNKLELADYDFALSVDDAFIIPGRGTAVCGCISTGTICINERVEILHEDGKSVFADVIGIEMSRKTFNSATAGDNVGLLLYGITKEQVSRGDIIVKRQMNVNSLDDYILKTFKPENKVQAIKYYREMTGLGLKEAKDAIDRLFK